MPYFEYDDQKSEANKGKHGLNFEEGQRLWRSAVVEYPIKDRDEMRYLVLGKIDAIPYTAIISYRGSKIRIISVRKSNRQEVKQYAAAIKKSQSRSPFD